MRQRRIRRRLRRAWRSFTGREGRRIDHQLRRGNAPRCPCCDELLEARPGSRLRAQMPLDATGYDLDCRECRRFWCIVRHTARSIRLVRMRRLAAAVRAAGSRDKSRDKRNTAAEAAPQQTPEPAARAV